LLSPNRYWYAIEPTWSCANERRIGDIGDGGKYLCNIRETPERGRKQCVIYSFGSAGQDDFEKALFQISKCKIFIFDPTPSIYDDMKSRVKFYDAEFHSIGLGGSQHEIHVGGIWESISYKNLQVLSLAEIMKKFNHSKLYILKIDIEGSEYDALTSILETCSMDIEIILVEIHTTVEDALHKIFGLLSNFEKCGYRLYHKEPNYQGCHGTKCVELAFTRRDCSAHGSTLESNWIYNIEKRQEFLKFRLQNHVRNRNPRLFWDYYEPDTVCKSLEKVGGLRPEGLYTCALPINCSAILFGEFSDVFKDFRLRCARVQSFNVRDFYNFKFNSSFRLMAIRFENKETPDLQVVEEISRRFKLSCDSYPVDQISLELHWDFHSKVPLVVRKNTDKIHELFYSLQACGFAIFHKEPNLYTGRGHRYIMYSWLKFDLIKKDWEVLSEP
jgi:FkbM family methyltransferase